MRRWFFTLGIISSSGAAWPTSHDWTRQKRRGLIQCDSSASSTSSYSLTEDEEDLTSSALNQGDQLRSFLANSRGTGDFYQKQLDLYLIYQCENSDAPGERFVVESDPSAAKSGGECIVTNYGEPSLIADCEYLGSDDGETCCEVGATCYWARPVAGAARGRQYTAAEATAAEGFFADYLRGLVPYAAVGIAFAALTFLGAPMYCCAHLCCKYCKIRPDGYSKMEKCRALSIFIIFFVFAVVCGAFAYVGNLEVISGLDSVFSYMLRGIDNTESFISGAVSPLSDAIDSLDGSADSLNATVQSLAWVDASVDNLAELLAAWGARHANLTAAAAAAGSGNATAAAAGSGNATASAAAAAAAANLTALAAGAAAAARAALGPAVGEVADVLGVLRGSLVAGRAGLGAAVGAAADALLVFNASLGDGAAYAADAQEYLTSYDQLRDYGCVAIFAVSIALSGLTLVWIVLGKVMCMGRPVCFRAMNCCWLLNWLVTILAFLLAAVCLSFASVGLQAGFSFVLSVAAPTRWIGTNNELIEPFLVQVVWSDTCEFIDIMAEDFEPYLGESAGTVLNVCLNDSSLAEALNISATFSFGDELASEMIDLQSYNLSSRFASVFTQLAEVDAAAAGALNFTADLAQLSNWTAGGAYPGRAADVAAGGGCAPGEQYRTEREVLRPWEANAGRDPGVSAQGENYNQSNANESALEYMTRLYNQTAECPALSSLILNSYETIHDLTLRKWNMRADFGYDDATCSAVGCPTISWRTVYGPSIWAYTEALEANLTRAQEKLDTTAKELTQGLLAHAEEFLCNSDNCGFVGGFYEAMYHSLCTTTLGGFGQISLALFLLALCNIPIMICTCSLTRRLRRPEFSPLNSKVHEAGADGPNFSNMRDL